MMKSMSNQFFRLLSVTLIFLIPGLGSAQMIREASFGDYLSSMPIPQSTMKQTIEPLGYNPDKTIVEAFEVPKEQRRTIMRSFFELFSEKMAEIKTNSTSLAGLSVPEQK